MTGEGGGDQFYSSCHPLLTNDYILPEIPIMIICQVSCSALIVRVAPLIPAFHPATHTHILSPYVGTEKRCRRELVPQWVHPK